MRNYARKCNVLGMAFFLVLSLPLPAMFNQSALFLCASTLHNCSQTFIGNSSDYEQANCTLSFEACMSQNAYLLPLPESCFLADAAGQTLAAVSILTGSAYLFSTLGLPLALKLYANWINEIKDYDPDEHPLRSWWGKKWVKIYDDNGDRKLSAGEFISPPTAFGIISLAAVVPYIADFYKTSALCLRQKLLPPS